MRFWCAGAFWASLVVIFTACRPQCVPSECSTGFCTVDHRGCAPEPVEGRGRGAELTARNWDATEEVMQDVADYPLYLVYELPFDAQTATLRLTFGPAALGDLEVQMVTPFDELDEGRLPGAIGAPQTIVARSGRVFVDVTPRNRQIAFRLSGVGEMPMFTPRARPDVVPVLIVH